MLRDHGIHTSQGIITIVDNAVIIAFGIIGVRSGDIEVGDFLHRDRCIGCNRHKVATKFAHEHITLPYFLQLRENPHGGIKGVVGRIELVILVIDIAVGFQIHHVLARGEH